MMIDHPPDPPRSYRCPLFYLAPFDSRMERPYHEDICLINVLCREQGLRRDAYGNLYDENDDIERCLEEEKDV